MRAFALAAMVLTAALAAQAANALPADKATDLALKQCVEHARGTNLIQGQNGAQLDKQGFQYQRDAPQFLSATQQTDLGRAEYIKSPSDDGEVWGVGYDGGSCMIVTAATVVEPIEKVYLDYFGQPNMWHAERAPQRRQGRAQAAI